jgi:WD40 repeat protein
VRVFYAFEDDITEQLAAQLIGHRLSCTSGCFSPDEKTLVTSGRDQETILWDIEAQRKISNLRIEGNYTTDMVWIPDSESLFLQTGEDCKLRIFDTRTQLKAVHSYKIGDSFALSFDIDNSGNYLTTGHRGFNGKG